MSFLKDNNTTSDSSRVESRLAEARRKRGIAAAALAREAGVSRQTIYAMEAGDYVPNTAVALRLAQALETTVEDLFSLRETAVPPRAVRAHLLRAGELLPGTPVQLCRVGERLVGVPAVPAAWELHAADALVLDVEQSSVQLLGEEQTANRLLIAGCDPAASILARHLQRASVDLLAATVNSSAALQLLKNRLVHIAGTHLTDEAGNAPSSTAIQTAFPKRNVAVIAFAVWEEGLVTARGNPKKIERVADLARPGIRIVNREEGSGSRQLLDRHLREAGVPTRRVKGYEDTAAGHLPAAWKVYMGLADCCLATRSAARAFGLDFLPLAARRYDMVIRKEHLGTAPVERLLDTLTHSAFRRELETLGGYDTRETGRRII
ncbi:MAG TPA: substrate-binding domain-containing protein [Bryobacteraceae bacterium]|nr:substrate-binding domain-containing protein [Bryobacteraceae bacterium]